MREIYPLHITIDVFQGFAKEVASDFNNIFPSEHASFADTTRDCNDITAELFLFVLGFCRLNILKLPSFPAMRKV